jgi:glycosyltransferase involved in cell wall biosynthesis
MPKVSVIIPTYNQAHFIAESIQSVLDQTFQDFEIVVVDDGSTDNTKEVVCNFKDVRIKYIYQENNGVSTARNTGICASTGEYIAFLDSDDVLLKNSLEKRVQVLNRHPEVAFIYGWNYIIDEKGRIVKLSKKRQKHTCVREGSEQIRDFLIHGNRIGVCCAMARQRCLYEVGLFDPTFHYGSEDFDMWVRLDKRYAVACIAEPLAIYRIHSGSISAVRGLGEIEKSNRRIFESVFNDAKLGPLFSSQRPKAYFYLNLRFASYAYEERKMKTARRYLFQALKIYPKGFLKGLWLPWIMRFGKTWVPSPILRCACWVNQYSRRVILRILMRSELQAGEGKKRETRWFHIISAIILALPLLPILLLLSFLPVYPGKKVHSKQKQTLVALTFDDGYSCWTSKVMPILARYNLPATAFINDPEQLEDFTWIDVQELYNAGWEIGWHTARHINFDIADRSEIISDFENCRVLFKRYGLPTPVSFSYPWGKHDQVSMKIVPNYFQAARTTHLDENSPCSVRENPVHTAGISVSRGLPFCMETVSKYAQQGVLVVFVIHTVGQVAKWQRRPDMTVAEFEDFVKFLHQEKQAGRIKVVTFDKGVRLMQQREAHSHWGIKMYSPLDSWGRFLFLPVPRRYFALYDRIVRNLIGHRYPQIRSLLGRLI